MGRQSFDICSLAERQRVRLIGRDYEAQGFWRWESGRTTRRKVFYECVRGATRRLPAADRPLYWEPLCEIDAPGSPPIPPRPPDPVDERTAVEVRLMRVLMTERARSDRERGLLRVRVVWPETRPGPGDYGPEQVTRFMPTRADVTAWEQMIPLLAKLDRIEFDALWWRSLGMSWRTTAERLHCNEAKARRVYRDAVIGIMRAAAGIAADNATRRGQAGAGGVPGVRPRRARRSAGVV